MNQTFWTGLWMATPIILFGLVLLGLEVRKDPRGSMEAVGAVLFLVSVAAGAIGAFVMIFGFIDSNLNNRCFDPGFASRSENADNCKSFLQQYPNGY